MKRWQARLGPVRPPFLLLTLSCVALGVALAWVGLHDGGGGVSPDFWRDALLALLGGLAAHTSVNALNEYMDFKVGLDQTTQRTPFSGGSGVLPAHPDLAGYTLALGFGGLLMTVGVGFYFLFHQSGSWHALMPIGLLGLVLVAGYTPWVTRSPWLCLIAPGLGFGPVMVVGTQVALLGHATVQAWFVSLIPFFLVNNLLLLNQFPDLEPDRQAGRRTLPILMGLPFSVRVLGGQWALAFGGLLFMVMQGLLPATACLPMVLAPISVWVWATLTRFTQGAGPIRGPLFPGMAANVLLAVLTPLLLAIALFWH